MQTLIFSSQQTSKAKGFSLMELLIYLALAAVFYRRHLNAYRQGRLGLRSAPGCAGYYRYQ